MGPRQEIIVEWRLPLSYLRDFTLKQQQLLLQQQEQQQQQLKIQQLEMKGEVEDEGEEDEGE